MTEKITSRIKYIYLDIVGFTYNRTVETQIKIVSALNDIVKRCLTDLFPEIDVIYIPIGDGICICLLDSTEVYDEYITISEEIIRRIGSLHNPSVKGALRFSARIGINENVDNIITDINGNRNVCGSGINDAQRIMNFGDSNHILVGRSVADSLMPRDKYHKAFRPYSGKTKHNRSIEVYQYVGGNVADLNRTPPSIFAAPPEKTLSEYAAHYIATVIRHRQFILTEIDKASYHVFAIGALMAYLAEDSLGHSKETKFRPYDNRMPPTPNNTLQEQLALFIALPFDICVDLYEGKVASKLYAYRDCFEDTPLVYASSKGEKKLKDERPDIYKKLST